MPENNNNEKVLFVLGEINGQLKAMQQQIESNFLSTNQRFDDTNKRFDDLRQAINRRIDDHQRNNDSRFEAVEKTQETHGSRINKLTEQQSVANKKNVSVSSVSATVVVGMFEVIKLLVK